MFKFSVVIYDVAWTSLGLPSMPAAIAIDQHGRSVDERRRIEVEAFAEAEQLGIGRPPDLDPRLSGLLEVLARHDRGVSLYELTGRHRRAYAAASGRHGAMAVIEGDQVSITPISGDHLAGELLALLRPLSAGPGRALSMPSMALTAAMRAYADTADSSRARAILRDAGVSGGDIERVLTIGRQVVGSGSIGVYAGEHGAVRLVGSIAYTDTPEGRYAVVRRHDRAGQPYSTIIPADVHGLRRRLHELLAQG